MIDPRAIIDPGAELAADVSVGPFSVIGPGVEIDSGTTVASHVVVKGPTRIGKNNKIYQFASVGDDPQDKKYKGEPTRLEIGDGNVIREYCTINRGTVQDEGVTRIGDDNWIMAYVHIAHDCRVGSHTIFANAASLAGHVLVADHAILGGFTAVHQFCRIGIYAFTGAGTVVTRDVPPFVTAAGHRAEPHGLNVEGLKRHGFSADEIQALRTAYKLIYKSGLRLEEAIAKLDEMRSQFPSIATLSDFLKASDRSIIR